MLNLDSSCLGRSLGEIFDKDSPFVFYLKDTLARNRPVMNINVIYQESPEVYRHLLVSTSLMTDVRREYLGALLHFRDITEMVLLQEKVGRQERLASLGKLVAGVAHEIRSPLTSINGYIQFWSKGHVPSMKSLGIVNRELSRLSSMTDKLLEFARPSKAVLKEFDLNGLVKRLVQFFADAHGGDIEISSKFEDDLPPALIDPHQIEQVLSNIMYNAYQAMSGRGRLEISTWHDVEKGVLGVSVKDDGCGIPKEVIPNMFEPFFTTKSKGTGLGLAIAHEIMEAHNGFIQVESELDQGTTVNVFLPLFKRGEDNV
jgi:two-component system sensor histidine kinase AtoS